MAQEPRHPTTKHNDHPPPAPAAQPPAPRAATGIAPLSFMTVQIPFLGYPTTTPGAFFSPGATMFPPTLPVPGAPPNEYPGPPPTPTLIIAYDGGPSEPRIKVLGPSPDNTDLVAVFDGFMVGTNPFPPTPAGTPFPPPGSPWPPGTFPPTWQPGDPWPPP
jgi:hypothetical protein